MNLSTLLTASFLSLLALPPAAASASTGVAKHGDKDDSSASLAAAFKNLPSSLSSFESSSFKTKTNNRRLSFSQCFFGESFGLYMETDLGAYDPVEFMYRYFSNNVNIDDQTCTSKFAQQLVEGATNSQPTTFLTKWSKELQAPVVETCEWLSEQSDEKKDTFCGRKFYSRR